MIWQTPEIASFTAQGSLKAVRGKGTCVVPCTRYFWLSQDRDCHDKHASLTYIVCGQYIRPSSNDSAARRDTGAAKDVAPFMILSVPGRVDGQ